MRLHALRQHLLQRGSVRSQDLLKRRRSLRETLTEQEVCSAPGAVFLKITGQSENVDELWQLDDVLGVDDTNVTVMRMQPIHLGDVQMVQVLASGVGIP